MNSRMRWSRILKIVGCLAMMVGTLDPMEGSLLILPGSACVALGIYLSGMHHRQIVLYWAVAFILIGLGVAALFGLSALGGLGGNTGRSMWWGLLIVPYPVGWLMAFTGGIVALMRLFNHRHNNVPI